MSITFKQIPSNIRVPLFYAELDPSHANTGEQPQRTLIIGQITAAGTLTPNVPVLSQSVTEAISSAGAGSLLARMVSAYRKNDSFGEVWYLPLADDGAAVAASGTITVGAAATGSGTISLYIGGQLVSVAVSSGQTTAQIATAIGAAINAATNLAVTAAVAASVVTVTAKNKGIDGNDIDIRLNYQGSVGGEQLPAGVTVAIVAMANGAANPALTTALANLQDLAFDFIVSPYTDSASIAAISAFLNDQTGRWSWSNQLYGHCFIAKRGTSSALATFGATVNDQHLTCMGFNDSPSPGSEWAAAVAGAAAVSLRADPVRPLQTVSIAGVLAPPLQSRFLLSQRNTLLFDGISTFTVDSAGTIAIENLITTYQTNALGQADNSYLQVETMFTLAYVLGQLKSVITSKYARVKLAADGTRLQPGSNVVTPSVIKADLIATYRSMEPGYVQQSDVFAANLVVEKDATNPNRVNVLWPGVLTGGLRIFALLAQFRLQ